MIDKIIDRLAAAENLTGANHILEELSSEHPQLIRQDSNVYQYQDCMINVGLMFTMGAHAAGLQRVKDLCLSCAPELLAFLRLRQPGHCVLVTRIHGMTDQPPMPWDMRPVGLPSAEDFARVMDDAEALRCAQMFNIAMLERRTWNVLPSGQIIISNWSQVVEMPEKWKDKYRQQIRELCGM